MSDHSLATLERPATPGTVVAEARGLGKTFAMHVPWTDRLLRSVAPGRIHAVEDVSFTISRGRTLALVGESGCGKSTLARLMVGLEMPTAGSAWVDRLDVQATLAGPADGARALRRRMQMVFQDPYASLDPRWRVGDIVAEPLLEQGLILPAQAPARVAALLASVGLDGFDVRKFPHQFSGGQRQRISIARAIATSPEFLVCDEPTSALDVSVQAQVLNLLVDLQRERALACLFISHNLVVVRYVADDVGVMYLGRLVELAPKAELFAAPRHPYTRMLLAAVPDPRAPERERAPVLGELPDPLAPPAGCAFHPRCPHANERCRIERPLLLASGPVRVACHAVEEGRI
ncbi:ABC transporter ATP-binding protein [Scleromatobacter humisilvae]|uniref:ATP-binding cassette domain-containing protein n=1 Tax=Scleromatobacter humisilvae TaxID=2897159 RepID=A0A9X1YNE6_9BURK|nr:oligopeptide/dipeptide ABC transporter ATP-binding protein [Scleromatobacter humisilvae]MCK9688992.1 ATP-binding cassette domain-containing protein [Scleromatobacter humisilvae]